MVYEVICLCGLEGGKGSVVGIPSLSALKYSTFVTYIDDSRGSQILMCCRGFSQSNLQVSQCTGADVRCEVAHLCTSRERRLSAVCL